MPNPKTLLAILDPRGRCNRKGLLIAAMVLLAVQTVAAVGLWLRPDLIEHPATLAFKTLMVLLAISAGAQRLHDLGRTAWWLLWSLLAVFGFGLAVCWTMMFWVPMSAMQPGGYGFVLLTLAIMLPTLGGLMWLHMAPGEPRANRFGPVPDGMGFARRPQTRAAVQIEAVSAASA